MDRALCIHTESDIADFAFLGTQTRHTCQLKRGIVAKKDLRSIL